MFQPPDDLNGGWAQPQPVHPAKGSCYNKFALRARHAHFAKSYIRHWPIIQ